MCNLPWILFPPRSFIYNHSAIHLTSVTPDKSQIHVFFLLVRGQPLIMPVTVGMFSGYIRDTSPSFLMSPHAPYGVEHFKNHSGRSSSQSSTVPSVPLACMMRCQSGRHAVAGALRSDLVSLTRIMRISSPTSVRAPPHCNVMNTSACVHVFVLDILMSHAMYMAIDCICY